MKQFYLIIVCICITTYAQSQTEETFIDFDLSNSFITTEDLKPYLKEKTYSRISPFEHISFNRASGDHSFRYAIPKQGGYPLSVYRLRFRPKTRDTGAGMEAEKNRAASWLNAIKSAN